ncbi:MAG TPA: secretin N-terminal domain-containing protein [Methylomirabilota bacterium]|nr:secretin N-terminal domain-containing protein [Methylomirabilota bacterium]
MRVLALLTLMCATTLLSVAQNNAPTNSAPAAAPTVQPAADANARNIRFQFEGIPYADVVERFAQMTGKPLISGTNVQGTLTYSDPQPYTYTEALDTLNTVLSMKGVMLVDLGKNLQLVPLKELPQLPHKILRGVDPTGDVRPGEVLTVVLNVNNLDAKEVADSVTPLLSNAGSVAALSRGRGLIVTDRLANIQRIRTLLNTIDTEAVQDRQMKTYTLVNASGAIVSDLLNRTFGVATAPKRTQYNPNTKNLDVLPPDPNDYITSVYDDASRTLVLFGPRERVALAEELIMKFEQKDGAGGDVRIYYPQTIKADELAQMIRQAIPGVAAPNETAAAAAMKARLIADAPQNRLIVAAPMPGQLDQIEQLINRVDKPIHGSAGQRLLPLKTETVQLTKVFRPRTTTATNVATILQQVLTRRGASGQPQTTASISYDAGSESVVVSGTPNDLQIATDIISQLETGSSQPVALQTKFFDVGSVAEARRLQPLIEQLYRNQVSAGGASAVAHAKIMADTQAGRLIVTASEDHLQKIEALLEQFRTEKAATAERRLQIIPLQNTSVDVVLKGVTDLVNERMGSGKYADLPKPGLTPDATNNRLLVTATAEQIREIEEIVRIVDVAPEQAKRDMRLIPLRAKTPAEIIPLVTQLLESTGERQTNPRLAPKLMADPTGKQIIVTALPADLERVEKLVQQFDATLSASIARQMRTVQLNSRNAAEFTPLVEKLYSEQLKGQLEPPGGPATLIAEPRGNRIMVSGSEAEITRVETIIRQLDPVGPVGAKEETRVLRLKAASAADLVGIVEKSLNAQQQQVRVLLDARSNSLVVTGEPTAVQAASEIIQQLDARPNLQPRELRIIDLKSADATAITPTVTSLFTDLIKDQRGADYVSQTKVVPDPTGNRIIVTGGSDEIEEIASIVKRLDQVPDQGPGSRVFKLTTGDAVTLAPIVQNAMVRYDQRGNQYRRVSVTADQQSNSLVVSGTRADLADVASVIEKLDGESSDLARQLRIVEVKSPDPDALAALASKVFAAQNPGRNTPSLVNITPEPGGRRLIVLAPANLLAQVETVITTLDSTPEQGTRELHVVQLQNRSAAEIFPKVNQVYLEQAQGKSIKPATIYPDPAGKLLTVYGTVAQADAIRQIVTTFDAQNTTPARETRTIDVGSSTEVDRLAPIVQRLYQDQWKDKAASDPADAQVVPDARSGRLIVTGKPEHLTKIQEIIDQVKATKPSGATRDTRVYDLTAATALELATTVRTLYTEEAKGRVGAQPSETLILPDAAANRLVVTGDTNELDRVEEIIKKLDKVSAQSASTRVFKLKSANPDKVAEILSSALIRYDAYGRPQKRVSVVVDGQTRTLIATGDAKELQGVSVIIEQLDASLGAQPARQMKVLQVKAPRLSEFSAKVRQLYADQIKTQPELTLADALILDDASSNQMILAGSEAQLALIEKIVTELQNTQASQEPRITQMIPVANAEDISRVMPTVQQLYQEHWKSKDANDPADAQLIADARNSRLIVTGRTNHVAAIARLVEQVSSSTNTEPRETRIYELKNSVAADLSTTLRAMYLEEARLRSVPPTAQIRILPDATANRLVISGGTNELARVEEMLSKLDQVNGAAATARVFELKRANASQVATVLSTALVEVNAYGVRVPRVTVGADTTNNIIVVNGEAKDLQTVATIVEKMDSVAPAERRQMRIFPLKSGAAVEFAAKIERLYREQLKDATGADAANALIIGDETSRRLLVTATEAHLTMIQGLVQQLEEGAAGAGRQSRVLPLKNNSAQALGAIIRQLFARQIANPAESERLVLTSLADDRTLFADGPAETLDRIAELLGTLDTAPAQEDTIHTVHLKKGRAEDMAQAINQSITSRNLSAQTQAVKVTPVSGANSLLITGPKDPVGQVMKIVQELDQESAGGEVEVRIYKLENGTAREVSSVLQQLLQNVSRRRFEGGGGGGGRFTPASVTVDERSNSLIISGTTIHFSVVEKILPTLDKAPERSDRDVQFVWLRKAKAYDVSSKLAALFEERSSADRPLIEPDIANNSLTIIARKGDMAQIQDLISRLDDSSKDASIQVRMRTIDSVGVEQMARMLQNLYPQMSRATLRVVDRVTAPAATNAPPSAAPDAASPALEQNAEPAAPEVVIAVDKEANALILSGPAAELDNIDRLITDLAFSFYGNESEFRVFSLKHADPVVVARMLGDLLRPDPAPQPQPGQRPVLQEKPRITVVPEPRTRGVVVRARPTDFALLESIIKQLDTAGEIAQVDFRVIPLVHASPYRLLPLVQQMVQQLNTTRPGEQVSITPDPRSRGLLVVSRPSMIEQVERMIRSLDTPAATAEAEVLIIPLKEASAAQIAQALQTMIRPGQAGEMTPENRELQEQVRRLKVHNTAGEAVSLDLSKPIKVAAQTGGEGGNRLILTSTPENLTALAAVVEMLDKPLLADGVEVRLIPLEHADANSVSQTLNNIFAQGQRLATSPVGRTQPEGEPGKALTNPLNVAVDQRSNTLILSGRPESLDLAIRVVKDLDQKLDRFVTEVRLFRLKHATASRLTPLLQSVFTEGPPVAGTEGLNTQVTRLRTLREPNAPKESETTKTRSALVIQADDLSNTLVVSARSDTLPLIQDVIEQLDIPAASGLESVRVYPLNHADPNVLMRILSDLYTGPRAATIRAEDRPIISIDPRTASLVVAGNSKAFGMIEGLLSRLDQKLPFELRDIKILPLAHADARTMAATLQQMLDARVTQQAALNRGQTDSLKVIVLADDRSNSLIIGGNKDSFELAEQLAKQLDNASPAISGTVRLVNLQHADARVIAQTFSTLFSQRYAAARNPDAQRNRPVILPDPRSNSLLVTATMEDNGIIDDLLKRLDQKLENPALTLTVLPLKHNDAARTATMIESIFAARQRAQTLPGQTPLPSEQIKLEPDSINNALIVSASKENLDHIQALLEKIDVEPTLNGGLLQIFTLQYADAQRLSGMITSLISQGLYRPGMRAGAQARTPAEAFAVSVDPRSNSLLVSASPENLAIVREVIAKLDTIDYSEASAVKAYPLKNARASTLASTLTQYFQAKRAAETVAQNAGQRILPVSVIPDDRTNVLLVTGGKEAFDTVDRLLQQLDGEGIFSRMNFRVFPLQKATATVLQPALQQIFANRPPRVRGEPLDPITIVADRWVNALLVGATVEDMANVESLLQRLDVEQTENGIAIHVFPLAKADARRIAVTIQGLYRDGNTGTAGLQLPVSVTADERMNAIVVSAGENDAKRIGELIRKLDTDQVARVSEIKVFPLQYARAESLSTVLNAALNTKPAPLGQENPNAQSVLQFITKTEGEELVTAALKEGVLITPDMRMNSLIVSGPVDYMGLIEQIISRLDASSPQQAKIKVFPLQNADARQMADLLMNMFHMTQAATPANQRSIKYTLMSPNLADGTEQPLASATLGTAEQNALTVTVDLRTNSLLVGGTDHYVELVSEIINALDSTPPNERKTEVVRLKNTQAAEVATAIRTFLDQEKQRVVGVLGMQAIGTTQRMLEQEVAVVAEPISNTLLLSANPRYFTEIKSLIDELDKPQAQVLIQVLLAEVTLDALTDLGFEWSYQGSKGDVDYGIGTDFSVADQLRSFGGFHSTVAGSDFTFLLRALKQEGRLEVMSRPQIVTADNKPASINVGQRVPLITDSRVTERGDTINSFRYEDIGVNLTVTPKISPDGFVKMEIGTTNSAVSSATVEINASAQVPIINQRKANTTVSVQSGQTVIIGGLIAATDDQRVRKVPWLGDIPYVGAVFRSKQTVRDRKELLVLLTPQVLANSEKTPVIRGFDNVTREHLDRSRMKDQQKRDDLQKQLLEPLYPKEKFEDKNLPQPKI